MKRLGSPPHKPRRVSFGNFPPSSAAELKQFSLSAPAPESPVESPRRCSGSKSPRDVDAHGGPLTKVELKFPLVSKALAVVKEAFNKHLAAGCTDSILVSSLSAVLAELGVPQMPEDKLKQLFELSAAPPNSKVSFKQFLTLTTLHCFLKLDSPSPVFRIVKQGTHVIEEAFKKIDQDGNGELESSELRVALFEVGHADKDILEERFKELDVDRDGHIRFKNFIYGFANWVGIDDDEATPTNQACK